MSSLNNNNCDFNENPKSDFDFDLGFVNIRKENHDLDSLAGNM